jgi:hypothetical protein
MIQLDLIWTTLMPKDVRMARELPSLCFDVLLPFGRRIQFLAAASGSSCTSGFAQHLEGSAGQSEKTSYELDALRRALIDGTYRGPSKLLLHPEDFWGWKRHWARRAGCMWLRVGSSRNDPGFRSASERGMIGSDE